jgi:hypothetical protein
MVERKTPMATRRKKNQGLDATGLDIDKAAKRLKIQNNADANTAW